MSRPERGVRFLFVLDGEDESEARYALTIFTPDAEHRAAVFIACEGGAVRLEPREELPALAPLLSEAGALAKTIYTQRRSDAQGRFKRRVMRWRP